MKNLSVFESPQEAYSFIDCKVGKYNISQAIKTADEALVAQYRDRGETDLIQIRFREITRDNNQSNVFKVIAIFAEKRNDGNKRYLFHEFVTDSAGWKYDQLGFSDDFKLIGFSYIETLWIKQE